VKILQLSVAGLLGCMGGIAVAIHPTFAQLTPDNSLGKERSLVVPFDKNNDIIQGGAARGTNLFHSFKDFNVGENRGVYFANPEGINNIFSRVTGDQISNILGNLGVLGNANLFLLNPNGIVFGKNASLDVQGSFMGTTANSLVFPNGVEFSATNPQAPPLLAINVPIGLQFGSQPRSITNQAVNPLSVGSGSTLALMGGEITLDGSVLFGQNGQVKLGAVGGDTTVGLNINGSSLGFTFPENVGRAPINLKNARIIASGENSAIDLFGGKIGLNNSILFGSNGGSVIVDGNQLSLNNNSSIWSGTSGAAKGGNIQIQASDAVTLANSSFILSASSASATGSGGDVTINAGKIAIAGDGTAENSSGISAFTTSQGNGGNLTLNATESVNINGGKVSVATSGTGNAGNLTVRAKDAVNITDKGALSIVNAGSGSTGNLRIETGTLRVQNTFLEGGVTALASGSGSVGSISIQARNGVEVTNSGIFTGVVPGSTSLAGAGDIMIETQRLNLKDAGSIRTDTFGRANAANIFIKASEYVDISGFSSGVSSRTFSSSRNGGNVTIETPRITVSQGGRVSTSSIRSSGNAGNITIRAKDVELDGFIFVPKEQSLARLDQAAAEEILSDPLTQEVSSPFGGFSYISMITSEVQGSNTDARGGTITIDTERLRLSNGGNISTSVLLGQGQGGNLVVRATDSIDITGVGGERLNGSAPSGLFAELQTGGIGSGGSIDVTTGRLNLSNNGEISASTFNQGNAGTITINANQVDLRGSSSIRTQVDDEATGDAGNISIKTQLLNVQEESQISSGTQGNGNAGKLTVQADSIILTGSDSQSATGLLSSVNEGANGQGGDIDITTNRLIVRDDAEIVSGSIGTGDAGNIQINANFLEINGKGSGIASFTNAGNGGNISLNIGDLLLLRGGGLISSTAGRSQAGGNGGNININSKFIVAVPKENSDISANAFTGAGGNIQINSQGIFGVEARPKPTQKSDITASSELGVSGVIKINTLDTSSIINSFAQIFPTIDTNALIADSCIARGNKRQENSFFITGSGALNPNRPGVIVSHYTTGEVRGVETTSRPWKKGDPIIEATGLYRLSNGQLLLSRECD
jgi:filamentous hemagglutinin family protein